MKKVFKLKCVDWNSEHVRFAVFDPRGANCGFLNVATQDALMFVSHSWDGIVDWNEKPPKGYEDGSCRTPAGVVSESTP